MRGCACGVGRVQTVHTVALSFVVPGLCSCALRAPCGDPVAIASGAGHGSPGLLVELQVDNDGSVRDVAGSWEVVRTGVKTAVHNGPMEMVHGPDGETLDGVNSYVGGRTAYVELTPQYAASGHGRGLELGREWTIDVWVQFPLPNNGERWNTLTRGKTDDHQVLTSNRRDLGM